MIFCKLFLINWFKNKSDFLNLNLSTENINFNMHSDEKLEKVWRIKKTLSKGYYISK
jgi:hypothetical protein